MDETTNLGRGSTEDDVVWQPEATEETTEFVAGYGAEPRFRPGYEGVRDGDFAGEYDDFAADGGPDEVERARERIAQTRVAMGGTIDAIQEKLSPENLVHQTKDAVYGATVGKAQNVVNDVTETAKGAVGNAGDGAVSVGQTVVETIRRNPIPAALAGIGIGWLIAGSRKQSSGSRYSGYRTSYPSYGYSYGGSQYTAGPEGQNQQYQNQSTGLVEQAQGTVGQAVNQVQDTAGQVAHQVQTAVGQTVDRAQQTTTQLGGQAQYGAQQVQSGFQQVLQQQPLAVAAGALALGVAVGLAVPETPQEVQLMGPARETVMDQVEQKAQQTVQKVETVAHEAMDAATGTVKKQGEQQGTSSPGTKASSQAGKGSGSKS